MPSTSANNSSSTSSNDPRDRFALWTSAPEQFRIAWMELMGMSAEEIKYQCEIDPPVDLDEEVLQYNAMCRILESRSK